MPTCYSCISISGEKRISPGPIIYEGKYWLVEHAYPVAIEGWLVVVLKRHAESLHALTKPEFAELPELIEKTTKNLRKITGCKKEYVICLAEVEHFKHIHFHIIARSKNLPKEYHGASIFKLLKPEISKPASKVKIKNFCLQIKKALNN